ncbi:CBS domain-containing protein [Muriicola marianensis]|uniref:CBS domain-containing protein n=1 Tax=Muriicola marianensis TaxID=1324801 RepID=A0ABQ1QZD2_9FLAO|nr:CBS domain-containing protein [Muriicola marianensis]GGD50472.1 hypothetical protein GCM10011361_16410 [Muriicola marianensis]
MKIKNVIEHYHQLVSVKAASHLQEATSKMLVNDFSQLAVTNENGEVIGFISWKTIGVAGNFKTEENLVRDFMDPNLLKLKDSDRVIEHFESILEKEFAFISNEENQVYTILTLYDLAQLFKMEIEPFLELKSIESVLRLYIHTNIDNKLFLDFCRKKLSKRIKSPDDLTFGQYLRVLNEEAFWSEFQIPLHKEVFIEKLDVIRKVRNDIMHFKTRKLSNREMKHLKDINKYFRVQNAITRTSN